MTSTPGAVDLLYRLDKTGTGAGVGWFACVPDPAVGLEQGLAHLAARPMDRFMHRHVLSLFCAMEREEMEREVRGTDRPAPQRLALACEACMSVERFQDLLPSLDRDSLAGLAAQSPEIHIPWVLEKASEARLYWIRCFSRNVLGHEPLPDPSRAEHPVPVDQQDVAAWRRSAVALRDLAGAGSRAPCRRTQTAGSLRRSVRALQAQLESLGILEGWETRTQATLSPFAVERPWRLDVRTRHGRNAWRLTGTQTGYGRGLNIHQARVSCLMEIVERCSAFASFQPDEVPGTLSRLRLHTGGFQELEALGHRVLDLDCVRLEVPYAGQPLCWVQGEESAPEGRREVLVPAQLAFLFVNLDEPGLTSGMSSNGLGAGSTREQARLSGLLEVIERDAERVVPFSPDRVFTVEAEDPRITGMLKDLAGKGIHVRFADLTSELGVPCYQAFVEGPGGVILKGSSAHPDGRKALVSAITEIPWPYPYWFGTAPAPEGTPRRRFEDLPCWATGDEREDLELLETLLHANGYAPVYVDLTREDLGIPVCRVLVPGLEMMTQFDRFTPLGLRTFGHYLIEFA